MRAPGLIAALAAAGLAVPAAAQTLALEAKVGDGAWVAGPAYPLAGQSVRLRVAAPAGARVRWYQILPDVTKMHKNANFPWEADAYRWVGFGKIRYDRQELARLRDRAEVEVFEAGKRGELGAWTDGYETPFVRSPYYHPDVGSFWFQAEVEAAGRTSRSPGIESADHRGLSPKVLRVSVREGPDLAGWLSSFFNVPALFGSVPHQSQNHLGTDCADVLVAALGKWRGRDDPRNYNVDMLVATLKHVGEAEVGEGAVSSALRWGPGGVRSGDFVAVRYAGARRYQHIGLLVSDDGDGALSAGDRVLHAGPWPLAYDSLASGPFQGHVAVLRPGLPVVDRPIRFSERRRKATQDYIATHYGRSGSGIEIEPSLVVLHWTGTRSLEASWETFDRETLPAARSDIAGGGELNVSAHFLVGRDGAILRLMPEAEMARHVIGLNLSAIGIENVGGLGDRDDLTNAQVEANAWLVRHLKDRFPKIRYVIGHHEYQRFEGHPLWAEKDARYRTRKSDPGERFMRLVRERVRDLALGGPAGAE